MMDKYPDTSQNHSLELFESMTRRDSDLLLMAEKVEADYLLPAPVDLKTEILKKAAQPEVQLEIQARRLSKKAQLLLYSFKVGTAVAGALLLLSLSPGFQDVPGPYRRPFRQPSAVQTIREGSQQFSDYFNQFSYDLFQNGGNRK